MQHLHMKVALLLVCIAFSFNSIRVWAEISSDQAAVNVVEIYASEKQFFAPEKIQPGWTRFRFINQSSMVHFAMIERMPDGIGMAEQQAQVAPVFQQGMDLLNAGDQDAAMAAFGNLPEWFGDVIYTGGPGLTGAGQISETTVFLEPGTYLLECYVKTRGIFHSFNPAADTPGMVQQVKVVGALASSKAPVASTHVTISTEQGIQVPDSLAAGDHVIEVKFLDQRVHENFVGHDVHLVQLAEHVDIEQLEIWMDWRQPNGLQTPAPATFIGGLNEMSAGSAGYVHVHLQPGRYALIAEIPNASAKGMLKVFSAVAGDS